MQPRELPDTITELTIEGLWNALMVRWETLGVPPKRSAIELKLAHIKLETGLRHCHCWNLGNLKWKFGQSWTFFGCGEEIAKKTLPGVERLMPGKIQVKREYPRANGEQWVSIWVEPPHPWSKFAAFESLIAGIDGQLDYLRKPSHQDVLAALQSGDPAAYVDRLHGDGYFTADPIAYRNGVARCLRDVQQACRDYDWGDVA